MAIMQDSFDRDGVRILRSDKKEEKDRESKVIRKVAEPFPLKSVSSYQFGGLRRIFCEQLVFTENLYYYAKNKLKWQIERCKKEKIEVEKKLIDKYEKVK